MEIDILRSKAQPTQEEQGVMLTMSMKSLHAPAYRQRISGQLTKVIDIDKISAVLVSCDCYNKLTQSWWFTTTEMYSPTVLEARRQKASVNQEGSLLRTYGRIFPCLIQLLVAVLAFLACSHITSISANLHKAFLSVQVYLKTPSASLL